MYMYGHFTVFRHSPSVVKEFMRFPNLRDLDSFLREPWIGSEAGKYFYSLEVIIIAEVLQPKRENILIFFSGYLG